MDALLREVGSPSSTDRAEYDRPSDETDTPAGKKRRRSNATRACNSCRRRKTRCDGQVPSCSTCNLYHEECTYAVAQDGRRPASKAYVTALEDRVRSLEQALGAQAGTAFEMEGDVNAADGGDVPDGEGLEEANGDQGVGVDRLRVDDDTGELTEYGPTSAFKHLPTVLTRPGDAVPPTAWRLPPDLTAMMAQETGFQYTGAVAAMDPATATQPWLSLELHQQLLRLFFEHFNPWCGWVDEPGFYRDLGPADPVEALRTPRRRTIYYSLMLHNVILALGTAFIDETLLPDRREVGAILIGHAKDLFEEEAENPTLCSVVGAMLMASYFSGSARHNLGFVYAGIGLRLAQALGLGTDCAAWVKRGVISEETRRARERVFWVAYIQDKLWSSYVGRAVGLSIDGQDVSLPTPNPAFTSIDLDVAQEQTWSPPLRPHVGEVFEWTSRLALLAEKILQTVNSRNLDLTSSRSLTWASDMNLKLEKWHDDLPASLSIHPGDLRHHGSRALPACLIVLHTCYQFLIIVLHRPWYIRRNGNAGNPQSGTSTARCHKSASQTLRLLELFRQSPGLRYAPISLTQFTFTAGTIHLLGAASAKDRSSKRALSSRQDVQACVAALREQGQGQRCASQSADILQHLLDDWCPETAPPAPTSPARDRAPSMAALMQEHPGLTDELRRLGWKPPPTAQDEAVADQTVLDAVDAGYQGRSASGEQVDIMAIVNAAAQDANLGLPTYGGEANNQPFVWDFGGFNAGLSFLQSMSDDPLYSLDPSVSG